MYVIFFFIHTHCIGIYQNKLNYYLAILVCVLVCTLHIVSTYYMRHVHNRGI